MDSNRHKKVNLLRLMSAVLALGLVAAAQANAGQGAATKAPGTTQTAADQPPVNQPATTLSVRVNVVNVFATVRDKHGQIVSNLTKDDFVLSEDAHPQNIHYFAKESDLPLTLGLLVDTSLSQRRVLGEERSASTSFLDKMVRADKDKAFLIHFDREVELLQDLTSSHDKLASAINKLQTPEFTQTSAGGGSSSDPDPRSGRGSGHHFAGGTLLYDAVYLASDELMKKQEGRKALIVLSDGVDHGSKETLDTAIETAQRANTVVYSILFKDDEGYGNHGGYGGPHMGGGMGGPGMGGGGRGRGRYPQQEARPDGKKILERISKETGGQLFEVSKKHPVNEIYAQIEEELRNQYSLGYTPDRSATGAAPGYHKIQLAAKPKDLVIQTRDGYYAEQ